MKNIGRLHGPGWFLHFPPHYPTSLHRQPHSPTSGLFSSPTDDWDNEAGPARRAEPSGRRGEASASEPAEEEDGSTQRAEHARSEASAIRHRAEHARAERAP